MRHVNLLSALTSEFCHATNTGETRHITTLVISGDVATLIPGIRRAPLEIVGVHVQVV